MKCAKSEGSKNCEATVPPTFTGCLKCFSKRFFFDAAWGKVNHLSLKRST